jgi:hypothetical protein
MKFPDALTALIDQAHTHHRTRDETAAGDSNVRIAYEVFGESGLSDEFYGEEGLLDFGTFENCREYGVTVTVGGWTFAAYEHRNSDDICLEGCPAGEVRDFGPYGSDDKHDVLFSAKWKQYHEVAGALTRATRHVLANPAATRADVRAATKGKNK